VWRGRTVDAWEFSWLRKQHRQGRLDGLVRLARVHLVSKDRLVSTSETLPTKNLPLPAFQSLLNNQEVSSASRGWAQRHCDDDSTVEEQLHLSARCLSALRSIRVRSFQYALPWSAYACPEAAPQRSPAGSSIEGCQSTRWRSNIHFRYLLDHYLPWIFLTAQRPVL
jgi:hypothetical protein